MSDFKSEVLSGLKKVKKGFLRFGLELAQTFNEVEAEAKLQSNLAKQYVEEGDYYAAIEKYKEILDIAKKQGDKENTTLCCLNLGIFYHEIKNYERSIDYCDEYVKLTSQDDEGQATANEILGSSYQNLGKYKDAIPYYEQALEFCKDNSDQKLEITGNLGIVYKEVGEYKEAINKLKIAIQLLSNNVEHTDFRYILNLGLGCAYTEEKQYEEATEYLKCSLRLAMRLTDDKKLAETYRSLADVAMRQCKLQDAINYLNKWQEAARIVGDRAEIAAAKQKLGRAHLMSNEPKKAIKYYEQNISDADQTTDKLGRAGVLVGMGKAYEEGKQYELVIESYLEALKLLGELGDEGKYEECEALVCLGDVHFNQSQYEDASERYNLAWSIADAQDYKKLKGRICVKMGDIHRDQESVEDARLCYTKVIDESLGDKKIKADAHAGLGRALHSTSDYRTAENNHMECLRLAKEIDDSKRQQEAHENLGHTQFALKKWSEAADSFKSSCDIAENTHQDTEAVHRCEAYIVRTYYEMKDYDKAIHHSQRLVIETSTNHDAEMYRIVASCYRENGQPRRALEFYEKYLEAVGSTMSNTEVATVRVEAGKLHEELGDYIKATELYKKCLNDLDDLKLKLDVRERLGDVYYRRALPDDACECYQEIVDLSDDKSLQGRAHEKIGNIYHAIACSEEMKSEETKLLFRECTRIAIESYEKSLKLLKSTDKPATVRVLGKLGCIKRGVGQLQQAIDCHKPQLKCAVDLKDRVCAFENLIIDYELNGDYDEALELQEKYFEDAEKLGGQCPGQASVNIAKVHLAKGEYEEAIRKAESAEKMDNTAVKAEAYDVMGCAYTGQGQYKTARDMHLEEIRVMGSNDKSGLAGAKGNIGLAHMGAGDYNNAIASFRRQMKCMQDKREEGRLNENFGNYYAAIGECSKAITYCDKSLEIAEEIGDKAAIGRANACKGTAFTEMGQYQNALKCHEEEKKIAKKLKNEVREGQALGNLGNVYTNLCDHQRAIEHHKESLRIAEEHGVQVDQRRANVNLANAYMARGAHREAHNCLNSALAIAQDLDHRAAEGRIYERMAKAYYFSGEFEKAVEFGEKSLSIAVEIGDKAGEGRALGTLGNARVELGKNQQACFDLRKYLEISKELANEADEADALTSLAVVYIEIEQYDKAEKCCQESLQIARKIEDKARQGRSYEAFGKFYTAVGKYKDAIKNHKEHLKIAEELKDKVAMGKSNGNLGIAYIKTCEYKKALECQKIDKRVAMDLGNRSRVGRAQGNMGKTYTLTGQFEKAINCHLKHLKIAEELGDKRSLAQALHGLGLNYIKAGHLEKAKTRLEQLLEMSRPISEGATAIAQQLLGQCYRGEKDACIFFAKSIINFQGARNSVRDHDEFNISMSNSFANVYKLLFQSLLELNEVNTALLASDYGKAQALFDLRREVAFRGFQDPMMLSDPMETIATDPSSINSKNLLNDKLFNVIGNRQADTVVSYAFGENGELHAWVISGENVFHHKSLKRESSVKSYLNRQIFCFRNKLNLRGTQDDDNEAGDLGSGTSNSSFLNPSFSMSEEHESVESDKEGEHFAVKHSSFDHDSSSTPASVVTRKGGAKSTAKAEQNTHDSYIRDLYAILIEPIEPYLTGSKLLIVPDEALWTLPFAALPDPSGSHLCDKYSLQFIPSLHVLDLCLSQLPGSELGPALFVGNPKTDAKRQLDPLAFAEKEATTCGTYFNAQVLIGDKATKKNVLGGMKRGSIIHIAAHGCEGRADIVLTPDEESASDLLTDEDILKCSLHARLVVLSCCFSGRGEISPEGVVGIARSFLGSGARAVLVALWQINDKGAMEFMVEFYENLVREYPVCTAVQQAMIALKRRYPLNVWAPFLVIGEDIKFTKDEIESIRHQSDPK